MHWCVTIACAVINNNRPNLVRLLSLCCSLGFLAALLGCAGQQTAPAAGHSAWDPVGAKPITLGAIVQGRLDYDRPLPKQLTQKLSDQFTLVTIRRAEDWAYLWRRLHVSGTMPSLNFSTGMMVGILANVGEFTQKTSPIQIESILAKDKEGLLQAKLLPGAYYTIETAGYIQLTYATGLDNIRVVRIGQSTFVLGPHNPTN